MNRSMLVLAALALGLLLPAAAAAKGPSEATISGDVLTNAITISGNGETDQTPLGQLTMEAGFFPAAFGQSPDPMLHTRPAGPLALVAGIGIPGALALAGAALFFRRRKAR